MLKLIMEDDEDKKAEGMGWKSGASFSSPKGFFAAVSSTWENPEYGSKNPDYEHDKSVEDDLCF